MSRPAYTGPTPAVRELVERRDGGRCVRCGQHRPCDYQHRKNRGMGGTSDERANLPANGILLCRPCHEWVHAHPQDAYRAGWLVSRWDDPAAVPVLYQLPRGAAWRLLDDDGGWAAADSPTAGRTEP